MTELDIISRSRWGARHPAGFGPAPLPAREVWLHHSASVPPGPRASLDLDAAAVRLLDEIGHQRFGGGISYTFVIPPSGRIFEGHGVDRRGAHTAGRNTTSRAICLLGNYEHDDPTPEQIDAVAELLALGEVQGWWVEAALTGGHRDVKATACPGERAYERIPEINRRAAGTVPTLPLPEEDALSWSTKLPDLYPAALDPQGRPTREIDAGTQLAFATARAAQAVDVATACLEELRRVGDEVAALRDELKRQRPAGDRLESGTLYRLVAE